MTFLAALSTPSVDIVSPTALLAVLDRKPAPLVLHVGFRELYRGGHIPGSRYVGQAGNAKGLAQLKATLAKVDRKREVVLYCGCCPWSDCPNVEPAIKAVRAMGFQHARVLEIPTDFDTDWARKGYPFRKGD
jgi:hypothetical protein